jgi:hypothetical protein
MWVILIIVLVTYVLVNSPLFYSLLYVHKPYGISQLWGYAPNQFLFLVLVYPFAAFASLAALRAFVVKVYPSVPPESRLTWVIDNWPIAILFGLIIAALFTVLVYFTSGWSFDKLRPQYADAAVRAAKDFRSRIEQRDGDKTNQEQYRKQLINNAKQDIELFKPSELRDRAEVEQWLTKLSPAEYLQVVQDRNLINRLRLMDPAMHALNVFQILIVLFVGTCAVFSIVTCLAYGYEAGYNGKNLPDLKATIDTGFWAVFFFSFYVICYHQYRSQIEYLVGTRTTILQDLIAAVVIILILVGIRSIDPNNRELSFFSLIRAAWPILFFGSGIAIEERMPDLMRQVIGSDATAGFQIAGGFIFVLAGLIPIIIIILRA